MSDLPTHTSHARTHRRECGWNRKSVVPMPDRLRSCFANPRFSLGPLFDFGESSARPPDQLGHLTSASDGVCAISTMPERVLVADRGAASTRAAVHSTPA